MKKSLFCIFMCFVMLGMSGCGKSQETALQDDESQHVTLKWYINMDEPAGFDEVMEEANRYLNEKLNVTLDLVCIQPGDYDQKMQLVLASKEEFDIAWTSNWANKYEPNAMKGSYLALDDLLSQVPELRDFYKDEIWDATRVSGHIYGIPMNQVLYNQSGFTMVKSIADRYDISPDSIKSMDDLEAAYQTVRDNEPDDVIMTSSNVPYFFDQVTTVADNVSIVDGKATDRWDELYIPHWNRMYRWNQSGFFPKDISTFMDKTSLTKAGKIFCDHYRYLPGAAGKFEILFQLPVYAVPASQPFMSRQSIQTTLNAISATSKHPVRALKLLNLMNSDPYLLNLICYGLEDRDFVKDPENPNRMERQTNYYISEYLVGNQFLAYLVPSYEDGVWEETEEANRTAVVDPNIGFSFDSTPVEMEMAQVSSVKAEYEKTLGYGLADPEVTVPTYQDKLELAGYQKVLDEVQRQYDQWIANQNKEK